MIDQSTKRVACLVYMPANRWLKNEPRLRIEAPQLANFETWPWPPTLIQFVPIGDYRSKFMGAELRVAYAFAQCVQ
jgi:hypothetical protein